ncbi:hypothetical protein INS49_009350 [Diaporthe citri]|uniref:uncharacterized protein n=1 Tax=Diaporthe citri TaxID=83186 RepID=UPI001C804D0F|nr:uncharacterized protein INS49_009350 [Diaporthe citri]KAG6361126.1 hypothetical protein INS49_009350 [Diaporthe citri]
MHPTLTAYLMSATSLLSITTARNVDWCASSAPSGGNCENIYLDADNIAKQIGSQIYTDYDNDDCNYHSGSIDDIYYTVYATTTGGDCRSTAEIGTVEGALYNLIQTEFANVVQDLFQRNAKLETDTQHLQHPSINDTQGSSTVNLVNDQRASDTLPQ